MHQIVITLHSLELADDGNTLTLVFQGTDGHQYRRAVEMLTPREVVAGYQRNMKLTEAMRLEFEPAGAGVGTAYQTRLLVDGAYTQRCWLLFTSPDSDCWQWGDSQVITLA